MGLTASFESPPEIGTKENPEFHFRNSRATLPPIAGQSPQSRDPRREPSPNQAHLKDLSPGSIDVMGEFVSATPHLRGLAAGINPDLFPYPTDLTTKHSNFRHKMSSLIFFIFLQHFL